MGHIRTHRVQQPVSLKGSRQTNTPLQLQHQLQDPWKFKMPIKQSSQAIRKAIANDTTFSYQSNQFDLISAIDFMIDESRLVWKWRWVKRHQDEKKRGDKWKGIVK
eukprot:10129947-Ditylum_brightwellii.AAC.1